MTSFPFAESITLLKRTRVGTNPDGNDVLTTTEVVVPGCVVWPGHGGTERSPGDRDTTVASINVLIPPGTVVTNLDGVRWRGKTYEVEGDPDFFSSPFTGTAPGVLVRLTKLEG
jgi:hypothetical protein